MKTIISNLKFVSGLIMAIAMFAGFSAADAAAQDVYTFTNQGSRINIRDNTTADPYPSSISVAGVPTARGIPRVSVTIKGFTHTFPDDVGALLVAPNGTKIRLFTDCMGDGDGDGITSPIDLTIDDHATGYLPDNPTDDTPSGTYKPARGTRFAEDPEHPADFASVPGPYDTTLASHNSSDVNGTWRLYIDDDGPQDAGSIASGWEISFRFPPTSSTAVISGRVDYPTNLNGSIYASVKMLDPNGVETIVYTNLKGYYSFPSVPTGVMYHLSVSAKGIYFSPSSQSVSLNQDTTVNWYGTR